MNKRKIIFILIICFSLVTIPLIIIKLTNKEENKNLYPIIELKGENLYSIKLNEKFIEPGYTARDTKDGDITNKVEVLNEVDTFKKGVYKITYKVTNSSGKTIKAERQVKVIEAPTYKSSYNGIDNKTLGWGTNNKKDGTRPICNMSNEDLKNYNAYSMGKDEKVLYLTFDEGTLETYLNEIVDVLNKNNVKATFFLCETYIKNNGDLLKSMVEKGHSIGNHTAHHKSMPSLATPKTFDKYLKELEDNEKTFKSGTGYDMDKIYREPRGEYSLRSLSIVKDLGYKTFFWSAAYEDWDKNLTKQQALNNMLDRVHNGAIFLLHPTSKGNYLALDDFIKTMKKEGYTFDLVKNIK